MLTFKAPVLAGSFIGAAVLAIGVSQPVSAADLFAMTHATAGCCGLSPATDVYGTYTATTATAVSNPAATTIFGAPSSGLARARADLATGELGVLTQSTGYGEASASVRYAEQLVFHTGAGAEDITPITVVLQWHGDVENGSWSDYNFTLIQNGFNATLQLDARGRRTGVDYTIQPIGQWASSSVAGAGTSKQTFTFTYNLKGANPIIDLATSMRATSAFTSSANVYHTAAINFVLPEQVTFGSSSGTFLSNARTISAAPEPAAWAMMIAGFGLSGAALRRRRSARA